MKVLLINARCLDTPNHPLGILYIAAVLEEEGHEVKVMDPYSDVPPNEIKSEISEWGPDVVGISSTTPQINRAFEITKLVKELGIPTILGGVHPTVMPREVLRDESVDFIVIGEGEETTKELVKNLDSPHKVKGIGYKEDGKLKFTKPRPLIKNLDSMPFPARHLLPQRWYFAPPRLRGVWTNSLATVMASRGCPYRCIFCSSHLMFGRKTRRRSIENILEELEQLRRDFNIDSVWFADDTFTLDSEWTISFCDRLKSKEWGDFVWGCQARVNTVNREMLKAMKEAGCVQIDYGVESGSEKVLKILQKDITPDQVIRAFKITKEVGIQRFASFILGTPGEKMEDIKKPRILWMI